MILKKEKRNYKKKSYIFNIYFYFVTVKYDSFNVVTAETSSFRSHPH